MTRKNILWTLAAALFVLWLLALVSSYTFGGSLNLLLIVALLVLLIRLIGGRRPL